MIELLGMSIIIGGCIMKSVVYFENVSFEIRGEREKEAAEFLREALTGVAKRKSGYIETYTMPYWKRSKGISKSKLQWWWINKLQLNTAPP